MTRELTWMGFIATLLIAVLFAVNMAREDERQQDAAIALRVDAVTTGTDLYAENCAVCHGAAGEGLGAVPALNTSGVRAMDITEMFRTIERGRFGTTMAAYGTAEGGIFTNSEIDHLVTLIQYANWDTVSLRVAELGLTPPEPVVVDLSEDMVASVQALPNGDILARGLETFAYECAACHGANAEGTTVGPALNTDAVKATPVEEITRIVENGVPGTLMAGWHNALSGSEIDDVVYLVQNWDALAQASISMPVIEAEPLDMSPEAIAAGQRLYSIACAQCHGANGYGTPLAPALNNQTFLADTPDAAIAQIIAGGVSGTSMPAWGGRLNETDIARLVAYLRSLEPTAPAIVQPGSTAG